MKAFPLLLFIMSALSLSPEGAMAGGAPVTSGRTVYIPPVFSNKDYQCPEGNQITYLPYCYDFSMTNVSDKKQTVTITALSGSFAFMATNPNLGAPSWPGLTMASSLDNTDPVHPALMNFSGGSTNIGQNLQIAFCVLCTGNGCNKGWTNNVDNEGGLTAPTKVSVPNAIYASLGPYKSPTSPPTTPQDTMGEWLFFHAMANFQIHVNEDRGAIIGRLTQRFFPETPTRYYDCQDTWTSPPVVVDINGGRAF